MNQTNDQTGKMIPEHEVILKMIETASPDDTAKLDEIDLAVWEWWTGQKATREDIGFSGAIVTKTICGLPKYTRSRDALKAIRPEGWRWEFAMHGDVWRAIAHCSDDNSPLIYVEAATEELAELHAIIQAVAYERSHA